MDKVVKPVQFYIPEKMIQLPNFLAHQLLGRKNVQNPQTTHMEANNLQNRIIWIPH
jgi:hypothetical protein